jgi:hypothetical protein
MAPNAEQRAQQTGQFWNLNPIYKREYKIAKKTSLAVALTDTPPVSQHDCSSSDEESQTFSQLKAQHYTT